MDSIPPFASNFLIPGEVYTRNWLINKFAITDKTINNSVYYLKANRSIFLFMTEQPNPNVVPHNLLLCDALKWQGQRAGLTNNLIANHERNGLEILVFYKRCKREYADYGLRYEGIFTYQSHIGVRSAQFVLRRSNMLTELLTAQSSIDSANEFNPANLEEAQERVATSIVRRRGQAAFRGSLLDAYNCICAITGCGIREILEAAHIIPYRGARTNHIQNGLLLRADIHTLFDLKLLSVNPDTLEIILAPHLTSSEYGELSGKSLAIPLNERQHPSRDALRLHRESCSF